MVTRMNPIDVLGIASAMERNACGFYEACAAGTEDAEAKAFFLKVAKDEARHAGIFESLIPQLPEKTRIDAFPGDEAAYYQTVADEAVFSKRAIDALTQHGGIADFDQALDLAYRMEVGGAAFYEKLVAFLRTKDASGAVAQIIVEERAHRDAVDQLRRRRGVRS